MEYKIKFYESEYQKFQPYKHFISRIHEMEKKSRHGAKVALKWKEILNRILINEIYPVAHPIGQETFSLYTEFPSGVFEYALDIDGACSLIKENNIKPVKVFPLSIIDSVDLGNINRDPNKIKPNHKNPVMVVKSKYLTGNKPYCINGNHRIFEAYRKNDKLIEIYVFEDLEFVPFFYDTLSKATYFFEIDYRNVISNKREFIRNEEGAFAFEL